MKLFRNHTPLRIVAPGYPLGLLFVAIAIVAALLALDAAVMKDAAFEQITAETLIGYFATAGMIGFFLGTIVGAYHYRHWGILLGGGIGAGLAVGVTITAFVIDAVLMNNAAGDLVSTDKQLAAVGFGAMVGFVLGIIVGAYLCSSLGILVSGGAGAVLLPLLLPVLMAKEDHTLQVLIATVIGCGSILGIATMIRLGVWRRRA